MKLNILKANRIKIPQARYTNWKKEAPDSGAGCWKQWFSFKRYWSGKMWYFTVRHHQIVLDFRMCPWSDMMFPTATKKDRKAIKEANTYL